MIESILIQKSVSFKTSLVVRWLIAIGIVALAVILPQLAHLAIGPEAGILLLPMYLPVLLGGCILGARWGVCIGLLSPAVSFALTSALGSPMPTSARLPFMMAELVVFAAVSGLFSGKLASHPALAFPAVILAQLSGRGVFLALVYCLRSLTPLTTTAVWQQMKTGLFGLALQAVVVPVTVILLCRLTARDEHHD